MMRSVNGKRCVAALSEAHRHDDLGGVDALADARAPRFRGPLGALAQEPRMSDVAPRDRLASLLVRDEARALEDAAQVVQRERRAGVESRAGHLPQAYHGRDVSPSACSTERSPRRAAPRLGRGGRRAAASTTRGRALPWRTACRTLPLTASWASCSSSATASSA